LAIDINTLDQDTITRVVADALTSSRSIDRIEALDTWRTRNSGFWRFRAHPAQVAEQPFDVVFKVERRWTPESAEGTHDALRRLSDLRHLTPGPSSGISFPEPLGWTREPPGVIMPNVEGVELFDVLADTGHALWTDPGRLSQVVKSCGEAFGWIHRLAIIDPETDAVRHEALQRLPAIMGWVLERWASPKKGSVIRSHNFSRNDFLVSSDAQLSVVDPPILGTPALLHEDVAWFTYQLLTRAAPGQRLALRSLFLEGYQSSSLYGPFDKDGLRAVGICEASRALGTAKRLLMKGNFGDALQSFKIALTTRSRVSS
jgi:hypothetical protein